MVASRYLTLAVAALAGTAFAVPVDVEKRAIDTTVFDRLKFFSQYAAASYCKGNNNSTNTKITCPAGNCPDVQAANTHTVSEFENSILTDVTGFVAYDTTNQLIVVSFRGSSSIRNWLTDLNFPVVVSDICKNCSVSTGFWTSWSEARKNVLAAVDIARALYPTYKIVVTGHSLGGALADLAAGTLRANGLNVDLYTYGAPKVGLAGISNFLSDASKGASYRVTHLNDPVPRLPPALLGYRHVSPEYYIATGNDVLPSANDVTKYEGINNQLGNEKDTEFDTSAHTWYFGPISSCGEGGFEFKA
ncbi:alpha/beta-hydrolase [Delitschia confertaspora ATCC 74209]|uniref:Alpha/beta-hydrolase n=1 Tax=Delitschia confertaspora ATCC 74209 TaxID=1513339 RepID=A0A9P4JBV8_9PLEO|nr:alpha/beta-hydrolase [Delitschia confertaspora ATCC 74209]